MNNCDQIRFGAILKLRWQDFSFFWPPTSLRWHFLLTKSEHFLTTYLPRLVNVVCECPLSLKIVCFWRWWFGLTLKIPKLVENCHDLFQVGSSEKDLKSCHFINNIPLWYLHPDIFLSPFIKSNHLRNTFWGLKTKRLNYRSNKYIIGVTKL